MITVYQTPQCPEYNEKLTRVRAQLNHFMNVALVQTLLEDGDDAFWRALQSFETKGCLADLKRCVKSMVKDTDLYTVQEVLRWIGERVEDEQFVVKLRRPWMSRTARRRSDFLERIRDAEARIDAWRVERLEAWERDKLARRIPKAQGNMSNTCRLVSARASRL